MKIYKPGKCDYIHYFQRIALGCCNDEIHVHVVTSTVVILSIYSALVSGLGGKIASRHILSYILFLVFCICIWILPLFLMHIIYSLIFIAWCLYNLYKDTICSKHSLILYLLKWIVIVQTILQFKKMLDWF